LFGLLVYHNTPVVKIIPAAASQQVQQQQQQQRSHGRFASSNRLKYSCRIDDSRFREIVLGCTDVAICTMRSDFRQ